MDFRGAASKYGLVRVQHTSVVIVPLQRAPSCALFGITFTLLTPHIPQKPVKYHCLKHRVTPKQAEAKDAHDGDCIFDWLRSSRTSGQLARFTY